MSNAAAKSNKMRAEKRLFHLAAVQCRAVLGRIGCGSNCRDQQEVGKEEEGTSNVSGLFKSSLGPPCFCGWSDPCLGLL